MFIKRHALQSGLTRSLAGGYDSGGAEYYTHRAPESVTGLDRIVARAEVSFDENAEGLQRAKAILDELLQEVNWRISSKQYTP